MGVLGNGVCYFFNKSTKSLNLNNSCMFFGGWGGGWGREGVVS